MSREAIETTTAAIIDAVATSNLTPQEIDIAVGLALRDIFRGHTRWLRLIEFVQRQRMVSP